MKIFLIISLVVTSAVYAADSPEFYLMPSSAVEQEAVAAASDADLLDKVTPTVVSVFPAQLVSEEELGDDAISRFFGTEPEESSEGEANADGLRERVQGMGSGVVVSPDGWIVTNSHVVHLANGALADTVSVEFADRRRRHADIVGVDRLTDLALLKVDATGLASLPMGDSDAVRIGDHVFAVGNPFQIGMTATTGMVSAIGRTNLNIIGGGGYESFIQTDAAINPGNSGGALVNAAGQLVGINTAIWGSRAGNVGIGFAVPTQIVREVITRLAADGEVVRGFFGIRVAAVTADLAEANGLETVTGARVIDLKEGGPAEAAGLRADDILVEANGHTVIDKGDFRLALSFVRPGEALPILFVRGGERMETKIVAVETGDDAAGKVATFSLAALPGVEWKIEKESVLVEEVTAAGRKTSLVAGMKILEVNGVKIDSADALEKAVRGGVNKVKVRASDGTKTLAVRAK